MFYAIYDMRFNPPGFNFAEFLALAEFLRQEVAVEEMTVVLVFNENGGMTRVGEGMPYSDEYGQMSLNNVVRPMVELVPSIVDLVEMDGDDAHQRFPYSNDEGNEIGLMRHPNNDISFGLGRHTAGISNLFLLSHIGRIKTFTADHSLCPISPDTITMTMRRAPHLPHRNNDEDEWMKAARVLRKDGYPVVIIDEYEDLLKRAAMYSQAKLNITGFCGHLTLLACLDVPYVMMAPKAHDMVQIEDGGQWPNARQDQRIAWGPDTAETILREVNAIIRSQDVTTDDHKGRSGGDRYSGTGNGHREHPGHTDKAVEVCQ